MSSKKAKEREVLELNRKLKALARLRESSDSDRIDELESRVLRLESELLSFGARWDKT